MTQSPIVHLAGPAPEPAKASRIAARKAAIKAAIGAGNLAEGLQRLEAALADTPSSASLQLLKARTLLRSGDAEAARMHAEAMSRAFDGSPAFDSLLATLALRDGDAARAARHAARAGARGATGPEHDRLLARLAKAQGDLAGERQALERLVAAQASSDPASLAALAEIRVRDGDADGARALLDQALAIDAGHAAALAARARIAASEGDSERLQALLQAPLQEDAAAISRRVSLLQAYGRHEESQAVLRDAIARGLHGFLLFQWVSVAPLPPDLARHVVAWAESLAADAPPEQRAKAVQVLVNAGRMPPQHLLPSPATDAIPPGLARRLDFIRHAPADAELQRPVLSQVSDHPVQFAADERPAMTVLVFGGIGGKALLPISSLDRYFAALGISAAYLHDFSQQLFVCGIPGKADGFEPALAWLRAQLEARGNPRLVTLGHSAGGFAAIRYGLALGAKRIVAFSPPTNLQTDFIADEQRAPFVTAALQKLPQHDLDLRPIVEAHGGQTPIHVVYGDAMPQDLRHAQHLADAPGVHLHPLAGAAGHASLNLLAREGRLLPFLRETLL